MAGIDTLVVPYLEDVDYSGLTLPIFVVYDHPRDFPDKIVVRVWDTDRPTNIAALFDTLEEARAAMPPHYTRMPRAKTDDDVIIETYI